MQADNRYCWCFAIGLLCALSIGCSDQVRTYPVKGDLKFEDGSPVMFGTIELYNAEHKLNARGKINRDGTFVLGTFKKDDGAVVGAHKVSIQQFISDPRGVIVVHDHGHMVKKKYSDYDNELEIVVKEDEDNVVSLVVEANLDQE